MIVLDDIEQGSPEWFEAKLGVLGASELDKVFTAVKGDYSKSAGRFQRKLIAQVLTGETDDTYSNEAMERGKELEQKAREWYELVNGVRIEQVGFIYKDEQKRIGCSPDGLFPSAEDKVYLKGLEIKCVIGSTMVDYMMSTEAQIVSEYKQQVQGSMFVTGLDEWDLLIYHPKLEPICITVKKDPDYQRLIEMHVARFINEMDQLIEKLGGVNRGTE